MSQELINKANDLRDSGKTVQAKKILEPLTHSKNYQIAVNASIALGICYANKNEHVRAIKLYEKAITICEKNNWLARIGSIYRDIGIVYKNAGKFKDAEKSLQESIEFIKKHQDEGQGMGASLGIGYSKLGLTYSEEKQFSKARKAFELSKKYLKNSNHEYWKLIGEIDECYFLFESKDYKKAQKELETTISEGIQQEKEYKLIEALILAAKTEEKLKNKERAKMFYNIARLMLKIFDSPEVRKKFEKQLN